MDSFCESDFFSNNFQECRTDDFYFVIGLRRLKVRRDVLLR
jgi:hypothetical protein